MKTFPFAFLVAAVWPVFGALAAEPPVPAAAPRTAPPTPAAEPRLTPEEQKEAARELTVARLNAITFPKVDFNVQRLEDAVKTINELAKDADPKKVGVAIGFSPEALKAGKDVKLTLTLSNVPMHEVIKYVTNLGNVKYQITPTGVTILALNEMVMDAAVFRRVGPEFFAASKLPPPEQWQDRNAMKDTPFSEHATVEYQPDTRMLKVIGLSDDVAMMRWMVKEWRDKKKK